jgi:CMP-N,N'-diacetyllegionaminic acid synthase
LFSEKNAGSVIGVSETEHSPLWCNTLGEDKSMENFIPQEVLQSPRQKLKTFYRINGAIYWVKTTELEKGINLYGENSFAHVMPKNRSIDIDDEIDFTVAKAVMEMR